MTCDSAPMDSSQIDQELWKEIGISWFSESSESLALSEGRFVNQQQSCSSFGLSLTLAPELLRGTPLQVALSGFCQHWAGSVLVTESSSELYQLSRPVKSIDVFLSHDWATSRWMKMWTLLLVFNSKAAAVASVLWSLSLAVLKTQLGANILPGNLWMFSSYFIYLAFLFFWQRIRSCLLSPRIVFLDKLCIHQENDELKQKGILGLGAFVRKSDRLLVLWSKRTFSRLWCAYEIDAFSPALEAHGPWNKSTYCL